MGCRSCGKRKSPDAKRPKQSTKVKFTLKKRGTLKSVRIDIEKGLAQTSKVARKVGSDLHTITLTRIFTDGKNSANKTFSYAPATIRTKKRKGRFTSNKVNYRNTDQLANSYLLEIISDDEVILGFADINRKGSSNKEIEDFLEERYGKIFDLTVEEDKEIDNIIDDFVDKINF